MNARKIAIWLGVLAGCGGGTAKDPDTGVANAPDGSVAITPVVPDGGVEAGDACDPKRWIASRRVLGTGCQRVEVMGRGVWETAPITSLARTGTTPRGLLGFCSYRWVPAVAGQEAPATEALVALTGAGGPLAGVQQTCSWITALQSAPSPGTLLPLGWQPARKAFLEAAGKPPSELPSSPTSTATVRVAVLDTAPDSTPESDLSNPSVASRHGYTIGQIVRDLTCRTPIDQGQCADGRALARVTSHLALGRVSGTPGTLGTLEELAMAIDDATFAWENTPLAMRESRLVLNISLGWEPEGGYAGGTEPDPGRYPAAAAVFRALERASCLGALIFASAGNDPGRGIDPDTLMFPAGWQRRPVPELGRCRDTYGIASDARQQPATPLVVAVGGVDHRDGPAANAQHRPYPKLVAIAEHAVARDPTVPVEGGVPPSILTGTSVASAVGAAAAALVWTYNPGLPKGEVLRRIEASGVTLGAPNATVVLGAAASSARSRISLCKAISEACNGSNNPLCGAPPMCNTIGARAGTGIAFDGSVSAIMHATEVPLTDWKPAVPSSDVCGAVALTTTATSWDFPCPTEQLALSAGAPWLVPQPEELPCKVCLLDAATRALSVSINPYLAPNTILTSPSVTVWYAGVAAPTTYDVGRQLNLPAPLGTQTSPIERTVSPLPLDTKGIEKATISFTVSVVGGKKTATVEPLLLK